MPSAKTSGTSSLLFAGAASLGGAGSLSFARGGYMAGGGIIAGGGPVTSGALGNGVGVGGAPLGT